MCWRSCLNLQKISIFTSCVCMLLFCLWNDRSASQSSGGRALKGGGTLCPSRKYGKMTLGITRVNCRLGTLWCEGLLSCPSQVKKCPAFHFMLFGSCCFCGDFHWKTKHHELQKNQWRTFFPLFSAFLNKQNILFVANAFVRSVR